MRANLARFPDIILNVRDTYQEEFLAVASPILNALVRSEAIPTDADSRVALHVACRVLRGVRYEQLRLDAARVETEELVAEMMRALGATDLDLPKVGQVHLDEGKLTFTPWGGC
jgi:hypothetical protein